MPMICPPKDTNIKFKFKKIMKDWAGGENMWKDRQACIIVLSPTIFPIQVRSR